MRAFVVVTHGELAKGIKMSVEMIAGVNENLYTAELMPSEGPADLEKKLDNIAEATQDADEIIIFTDLMGGSPGNTSFMKFLNDSRVEIITGVNFPLLLTALLTPDMSVEELITEGQNGIINLREMMAAMDDED